MTEKQPAESLGEWLSSLPAAEADTFKDAQLILPWNNIDRSATAATGVWLGGTWAAKDIIALEKRSITHVLTVNGLKSFLFGTQFKVKVVDLEDSEWQQLPPHMSECFAFLEKARQQHSGVLVHCTAGKSRSAAIVIAYLIHQGLCRDYDEALAWVTARRPWVSPNASFERQLREWSRDPSLSGASTPSDVGRDARDPRCELCVLERRSRWLDTSNPKFVILECDQCDMPMVVWRAHTMDVSVDEEAEMEEALRAQADRILGKGQYYIDKRQRSIFTHLHWHAREGFGLTWPVKSKL